ncbi:putative phosphodiesterase I [Helianthus debilis subsp. tardiflorus]
MWDEMTVTWTSGYGINEAEPFVEWGKIGGYQRHSPARSRDNVLSSVQSALINFFHGFKCSVQSALIS